MVTQSTPILSPCHWLLSTKRSQGDRGIGIVRPIGLRPQLRRIVQLVIRDHELRPWQGDDDVVALHFDVEVVVVGSSGQVPGQSSYRVRQPHRDREPRREEPLSVGADEQHLSAEERPPPNSKAHGRAA
jgi:hypothetical protein